MITTYTFGKNNTFHTSNKPDYSKILDDIILTDIIDKNSYLFKSYKDDYLDDLIFEAKPTKTTSTKFDNAIKLLANYKKNKKLYKLPFILNKKYTLTDGTPIIFYDDEIQIGFDVYKYDNFSDMYFINNLTPKSKKIIIDIYNASGINININL